MIKVKQLAAVATLIGGISGDAESARPGFDQLVVFGDSLSDNGNAGRFSNGPVWVEHLAKRLGLELAPLRFGGTNLAVGGARATGTGPFDLKSQTAFFLGNGEVNPAALYVVYAGGNDLRGDEEPARAAEAVAAAVDRLAAAGAQHILVPNLGDLGVTPDYIDRREEARGRAQALAFNRALDAALARVERERGVRLYRLDVFALSEAVKVGFVDGIHPDAAAHAKLGEAAYAALVR
jgi:phospholipase/lecithinase/hemolysin